MQVSLFTNDDFTQDETKTKLTAELNVNNTIRYF